MLCLIYEAHYGIYIPVPCFFVILNYIPYMVRSDRSASMQRMRFVLTIVVLLYNFTAYVLNSLLSCVLCGFNVDLCGLCIEFINVAFLSMPP